VAATHWPYIREVLGSNLSQNTGHPEPLRGFSQSLKADVRIVPRLGHDRRSQWPRGLRHEMSSPARTLGLWVRIPLKACMSVCVYSVFVLFYV
jgi:hypothetical protein